MRFMLSILLMLIPFIFTGCTALSGPSKVYPDTQAGLYQKGADDLEAGFANAVTITDFAYGLGAIDAQQYKELQTIETGAKLGIDAAYNAAYGDQVNVADLLKTAAKQLADARAATDAAKKKKAVALYPKEFEPVPVVFKTPTFKQVSNLQK